jgi:hypothetical protein
VTTTHKIADPESDQVTASVPAVGGKMEHCQLTDAMLDVEPNPDRPDFLPADEIIEHRYHRLPPGTIIAG